MKEFWLSVICILILSPVFATKQKVISSTIKEVTVYQAGAQVTRRANINIDKGVTELLFKGLPETINLESIQVNAGSGITIVSVVHTIDHLNKIEASSVIMSIEKRREMVMDSINILRNIQRVFLQEKDLILSNKSLAGELGVNATELEKMASFFRSRLTEIENEKYWIDQRIKIFQKEIIAISKQNLELNAQLDKPTSLVRVKISSPAPTSSNFELSYFISDAGWKALYDIRIDDINTPLGLFYKAQVFQSTGEEWKDVILTLSTGNPSVSNYKPQLSPYYLTFDNYYSKRQTIQNQHPFQGIISGRVTENTGEAIPGATILLKGTNVGVVTDMNGNYRIEIPNPNSTLVYSFLGYNTQEIQANKPIINVNLSQSSIELEEIVVTALGGNTPGIRIRGTSQPESAKRTQIPLAIEKTQVATEFKIEIPYTIPSDNQPYDVSVLEYNIPADYSYASVPKISTDAFLMASIPNWHIYELLDGNANLFFKGIYQGKTYLDLQRLDDTLTVSVGRDRDIQIKRESKKGFSRRSFVGSNRREIRIWEITVKNNKPLPVTIEIEDQFPVSRLSDIRVEQVEAPNAKIDEVSGLVKWLLSLQSGESRTLTLKYTVRYPQNRAVIVE